jgi:hypothetical protein
MPEKKSFKAVVTEGKNGAAHIALPFDPDKAWGRRPRHRLSGTVDGQKVRFVLASHDPDLKLTLMWRRDCGVQVGSKVSVVLWPEGPQKEDLAPDFLAALKAEPRALAFFTDLAQFYRKAWLRWIDATRKRPEERARRIREVVKLLKAGVKQRPI